MPRAPGLLGIPHCGRFRAGVVAGLGRRNPLRDGPENERIQSSRRYDHSARRKDRRLDAH
jgi:hypothetical protein